MHNILWWGQGSVFSLFNYEMPWNIMANHLFFSSKCYRNIINFIYTYSSIKIFAHSLVLVPDLFCIMLGLETSMCSFDDFPFDKLLDAILLFLVYQIFLFIIIDEPFAIKFLWLLLIKSGQCLSFGPLNLNITFSTLLVSHSPKNLDKF